MAGRKEFVVSEPVTPAFSRCWAGTGAGERGQSGVVILKGLGENRCAGFPDSLYRPRSNSSSRSPGFSLTTDLRRNSSPPSLATRPGRVVPVLHESHLKGQPVFLMNEQL